MSTMTIKEWAAEYRRINEAEREELKYRLPRESVQDSVRTYFALCRTAIAFSGTADEPKELWERRLKHYQALADTWTRLAHRQKHAGQIGTPAGRG